MPHPFAGPSSIKIIIFSYLKFLEISFLSFYVNGIEISSQKRHGVIVVGMGTLVRATPCAKRFSSYGGATRTMKGNVSINPKSYSSFDLAVPKTMDFAFVRGNRHRLIIAKVEKMPSAAISV